MVSFRLSFASLLLVLLAATVPLVAGAADQDPVLHHIVTADSVRAAGGTDALSAWLPGQPDLTGAAVAQLLDVAAQVGDAGNVEGEAENLVLVEALAAAHARLDPASAMPGLLAEYRNWDADDRAARATARALEDEAWSTAAADPGSALAALESADSIYAEIVDSPSRARVQGRIGATCWYLGDAEGVRVAYTEALERRRAVQDRVLESATLNGLGSLHFQLLGDLAGALDWYTQAIELRRALGETARLGTSLTYAANVQVQLGRPIEALALYEEAERYLGSPTAVVENLAGRGTLRVAMGRPVDAMHLYEEAAALCEETEACPHTATLLIELADIQRRLRQNREAQESLDRAEELLASGGDLETQTRLWQVRALISIDLGDQNAARDQMVRSLDLARDSGNAVLQCDGSIMLSGLYLSLGAADRARSTAEQALQIARDLGEENLQRSALLALGDVALVTGVADEATGFYDAALEIDERFEAGERIAQDLIGRGGALSLGGDFERARADLRRANALFTEAGLLGKRWLALLNIADSFEQTDPDSAAYYYDRALSSLEESNDLSGGEALNTGYLFADRGRAYEEITRYYATRHREAPTAGWDAKAFATAERSRARGLLELLQSSLALEEGPEALALIDSLYQIDDSTGEGRSQRDRIRSRLTAVRAARRQGVVGRAPASLDEVGAGLEPDALLLQYAVGDTTSLMWIVGRDRVDLLALPPRAELRRRVTAFRDALAQPGRADEVVLREGRALYTMLLEPAADRIVGHDALIVVPDDVLFELPFEALLEGEPVPGGAWADQPFFGRRHAPVLAPSSTVYLELRERSREDYDRQLVAVGDVDYSGLEPPLEPLPFTRDEVNSIGATLDDAQRVVLLGDRATEPGFERALQNGSSRVVHLATHGLIDPAEPARSCVALGRADGADGYLYSLEILTLQLQSPMIVLSACESALGRLERGEGVVGLTRSFLAAGAQGVVASLWPVPDASTAALMTGFYEELWQRHSAAASLRAARAQLLASEEWSHPYFWSAFVLVGTERMPW